MGLRKLFCKHDYQVVNASIVHYPDYEPHKVGLILKCALCDKEKRKLYQPIDFISIYGRNYYNWVKSEGSSIRVLGGLTNIYNANHKKGWL